MANIKSYLDNIKNAIYGKDVRVSIYDGISEINKEVENTTTKQVGLENIFDQLIINAGNSNAEIVEARVKSDGTSYPKLRDRLNAIDSQVNSTIIQLDSKIGNLTPCVCDGITDDSDNLQAYIDYVSNMGGGQIKLPQGKTIMIRKEIELKDNVSIVGYGVTSKIITDYGYSSNALNMLKAFEKKNIYLSNFYIENTGYGMSGTWEPVGTFDNVGACILAVGCDNFVVDNCHVVRGGGTIDGEGVSNIYFSCCSNSKAINNHVEYGDNGIMADTWYNQLPGKETFSNNGIVFSNNTITQMGGRGICIENKCTNDIKQGNIVVSNNTITKCAYAGVQGNNTWNCVITGNVIDGEGSNRYTSSKAPTFFGIEFVKNTCDCVISNNTIKNCYTNGIRCFEAKNLIISNNNILEMKLRPSQTEADDTQYREGIYIKNSSMDLENINISNNNIYDISTGITLSVSDTLSSKYNIISSNNITFERTDNIRYGILADNTTYSKIEGNSINPKLKSESFIAIKCTDGKYNTFNSNTISNGYIGFRLTRDQYSLVNDNYIFNCNTGVYLSECSRTNINSKKKNCTNGFNVLKGVSSQANKCRAFNCDLDNLTNVKVGGEGLIVYQYRSAAPNDGAWDIGDRIFNISPSINSYSEWIYYTDEWKGVNKLT